MADVIYRAINANIQRNGDVVVRPPGKPGTWTFINKGVGASVLSAQYPPPVDSGILVNRLTNRFIVDDGSAITRDFKELPSMGITSSASTSAQIDFRRYAGGNIVIPGGSVINTLTFYASMDNGQFVPLKDTLGSGVLISVTGNAAYPLPDAVFGVGDLRIVGDAAGTVDIFLKG